MLPYFLILIIPFLFQVAFTFNNSGIKIGKRFINRNNVALPIFFVCFLLLLSLRYKYLGRDLKTYNYIFNFYGNTSFNNLFSNYKECLFHFYCWFFYNKISTDYQLFISITAIISLIPIFIVYSKDKSNGYLKVAIFVNSSTFIMLFSGIRQGLAMTIGLLAYSALTKKKYWAYFLWTIIAMFTHHTGFMILFFLPLYRMRFKNKDLWWIVPIFIIAFVFRSQIFNAFSSVLGEINEKYGDQATQTGSFTTFVLFILFSIFTCLVEDEKKMDNEAFALRNILFFATALQMFASVHMLAMRMNYYFILLIPVAVGKSIKLQKEGMKDIAKVGEIIMCVFLTLYFFYGIYTSYLSGQSTLDTIPYVPFWQGN